MARCEMGDVEEDILDDIWHSEEDKRNERLPMMSLWENKLLLLLTASWREAKIADMSHMDTGDHQF